MKIGGRRRRFALNSAAALVAKAFSVGVTLLLFPLLIGYLGKVPVGWVSVGPREDYAKLKRSPVMKAVDERPVWSIICFVVPSDYRGQGVAQALLDGAVAYARKHGARLVEAYPVDKPARSNDEYMWFGAKSMYDRAGFKEVARRKPCRPIVRRKLP